MEPTDETRGTRKAQGGKDAVSCYRAVYAALGLDKKFVEELKKGRKK
jgi:hypothetical protein